jgi:hypothetical protein
VGDGDVGGLNQMNDDVTRGARLSGEDVEAYFSAGFQTVRKVLHGPDVFLEFDPSKTEIRLRTPATGDVPELSGFERFEIDLLDELANGSWVELRVDAEGNQYEAYLVMAAIVDLMRGGTSFATATAVSVESFQEILKRRQKLSDEAQVGLFGELIVFENAIEVLAPEAVMEAWVGPANEEHDFVFADFDAEVKTTRSESRVHLVNSPTQLEPTLARPLYLLSIQLTAGGAASSARTLGDQITAVRRRLSVQLTRIFDERLMTVGWRPVDADQYPRRWVLRTAPTGYLVDDTFPAITSMRLQQVVPRAHLISGINYRIDVSNLDSVAMPAPFRDLTGEKLT